MTYNVPHTVPAHAKINLFLDVTGRRWDGYHTLTGVMQSVSLADDVTLCLLPSAEPADSIRLTCSDPALPTDRGNLAYRAAEMLIRHLRENGCPIPVFRVDVHIDKHIPYPAGLAGGSADAAAVLRGMNDLLGNPFDRIELETIGSRLGADVPFCIRGGTCISEGIGDELTSCAPLPDCDILIACAGEGVPTPDAYRALDASCGGFADGSYRSRHEELEKLIRALDSGDLSGIGVHGFNLFESVVLPRHSRAGALLKELEAAGACGARMSGSGPSVFALFRSGAADDACRTLRGQGVPVWICRPVRDER